MSLITIIARSPYILSWEVLFLDIQQLELTELEVFPIPLELGFEQNAVGIAVPSVYQSKENVVLQLRKVTELLRAMDFELSELYNGALIINEEDVDDLLLPLLVR